MLAEIPRIFIIMPLTKRSPLCTLWLTAVITKLQFKLQRKHISTCKSRELMWMANKFMYSHQYSARFNIDIHSEEVKWTHTRAHTKTKQHFLFYFHLHSEFYCCCSEQKMYVRIETGRYYYDLMWNVSNVMVLFVRN